MEPSGTLMEPSGVLEHPITWEWRKKRIWTVWGAFYKVRLWPSELFGVWRNERGRNRSEQHFLWTLAHLKCDKLYFFLFIIFQPFLGHLAKTVPLCNPFKPCKASFLPLQTIDQLALLPPLFPHSSSAVHCTQLKTFFSWVVFLLASFIFSSSSWMFENIKFPRCVISDGKMLVNVGRACCSGSLLLKQGVTHFQTSPHSAVFGGAADFKLIPSIWRKLDPRRGRIKLLVLTCRDSCDTNSYTSWLKSVAEGDSSRPHIARKIKYLIPDSVLYKQRMSNLWAMVLLIPTGTWPLWTATVRLPTATVVTERHTEPVFSTILAGVKKSPKKKNIPCNDPALTKCHAETVLVRDRCETFDQSDEETWPDQKRSTYLPTYLPPYIPREHHSRACLSMTFSFLIYVGSSALLHIWYV